MDINLPAKVVDRRTEAAPHMPQLDGLRAIAVTPVLVHHYWATEGLDWAYEGVRLFFVLSGFLITGILLRNRAEAEASGRSLAGAVRRFYVRRALRIFPLYYFLIVLGLVLNLEPVREALVWFLTYSLNILMARQGWFVDNYAHFWSLAVEEQFYILWPWVVLFAPRRWMLPLVITFISIGPLFRLLCAAQEYNGIVAYISTPACLDSLGMGALLAVFVHRRPEAEVRRRLRNFALPAGLLGSALLLYMGGHPVYWKANTVLYDFTLALFFCWLIHSAGLGFRGAAGAILESKPLTYVGKISYGVYVYHPFMPKLCAYIFKALGYSYPEGGMITFILPTAATIIVASLSWYIMEKPINGLKRYFEYGQSAPVLGDAPLIRAAAPLSPSALAGTSEP